MADESKSSVQSSRLPLPTDDSFWLLVLIRVLRAKWLFIGVFIVLGLVAGIIAGQLMTPLYEARLVMVPSAEKQAGSPLGGLLGDIGGIAGIGSSLSSGGQKYEALALLRSRRFTEQFIVAENLLPVLFEKSWDAEAGKFVGENPPTLYDGYMLFDTDVRRITENLTEGTVTVSLVWHDRFDAARWANLLVARLNEYMRERTTLEANRTLEYLNNELENTSVVELRQVIYGLVQENIRAITMANVRKEYAFRVIDPAAPANETSYIRPNRLLLMLIGIAAGGLFGLFLAVVTVRLKSAA